MRAKVPLVLVTGFLGAGKTTFLKFLLRELPGNLRIAVVQNEYAAAGIDTAELSAGDRKFDVLEVINGSVFCVCLLASFIDSLAEFTDRYDPEIILLEASGLSDPIAIAEMMHHPELARRVFLSSVWCIIDGCNYRKVSKINRRIENQIRIADVLLINKTDLMGEDPSVLMKELASMNDDALILNSSWCKIPQNTLRERMEDSLSIERSMRYKNIIPEGRSDIGTVVLRTAGTISEEKLRVFISEVEGSLLRMKGFVRLDTGSAVRIQSAFGKTAVEVSDYQGNTELIGLGWDISPQSFGRRFHELRKS